MNVINSSSTSLHSSQQNDDRPIQIHTASSHVRTRVDGRYLYNETTTTTTRLSLPQTRRQLSLLQFTFRSNLRRGLRRRRQQQRQQRQRRRRTTRSNLRFSYRKALLVVWTTMGLLSYIVVLGWLLLSMDDTNSSSSSSSRSGLSVLPVLNQFSIPPTDNTVPILNHMGQENDVVTVNNVMSNDIRNLKDILHLLQSMDMMTTNTGKQNLEDINKRNIIVRKRRSDRSHLTNKRQQRRRRSNRIQHEAFLTIGERQIRSKLNGQGFEWIAFPACFLLLILSIHRVWTERYAVRNNESASSSSQSVPSLLQTAPNLGWNRNNNRNRNRSLSYNQDRLASVLQTLDLINQDRQERGEPIVSLESYLAFQQVLNDRSVWIGLAERFRQEGSIMDGSNNGTNGTATGNAIARRGISNQQLEHLCPQWTMTGTNSTTTNTHCHHEECSICLTTHDVGDILRTLPCRHTFHKDCIDRWMVQSMFCPMCKYSLSIRDKSSPS